MDLVVYIDYDLLPGLPTEAQEALLKAVSVFEAFSARPLAHEQFTPLALSDINGWTIRENKRPIASDQGRLR